MSGVCCRFVKALSFAAFDREDLLCPISHRTLQRSSSWRTMATADSAGHLHGADYIGIALPASIADMLHVTTIALNTTPLVLSRNLPDLRRSSPGVDRVDVELMIQSINVSSALAGH